MTRFLDVLERSAWTFVQTFAASVVLTNSLGLSDFKIAAGAAVLSVLKNLSISVTARTGLELAAESAATGKA
jgi:hypothetical protein